MTGAQVAMIVGVFLFCDFVIVSAIVHSAAQTLREFSAKLPAMEPLPDAVQRRFQSFKFGMISMGWCVHVAVDERCLHLTPARVARWLGMRPLSVPWEAIEILGKATIGSSVRARIAGEEVLGPAWCLRLAARE